MNNFINKFSLIVDIKNQTEALVAEKNGADALLLFDEIPKEIIQLEISGPQFKMNIVKEILEIVKIPLIVRVRIGNTYEKNILENSGIHYFYEVNIVKPIKEPNYIGFKENNIYITSCDSFQSILKRVNDGFQIIKISGKSIEKTFDYIKNIYDELCFILSLNNEQLVNYSKLNNISYTLLNQIKITGRLPCLLFISNIIKLQDINIFRNHTYITKLINGLVIENDYFSEPRDNFELFRSSFLEIKS